MTSTPIERIQKVKVTNFNGHSTFGNVRVWDLSQKDRSVRAFKFFICAWVGAAVSIVIPVAHFILVPVLFLAGPVGAYYLLNQSSLVLGGEAPCPDCGEKVDLVGGKEQWPATDLCAKCRSSITIEPV